MPDLSSSESNIRQTTAPALPSCGCHFPRPALLFSELLFSTSKLEVSLSTLLLLIPFGVRPLITLTEVSLSASFDHEDDCLYDQVLAYFLTMSAPSSTNRYVDQSTATDIV